MNFFQAKIRQLRKERGVTQQELADALNVKRSLIGAYEEGRAEPKFELLKKIANYFNISSDELISNTVSFLPGETKILAISVDNHDQENIELVPVKASAGYLNGYGDVEYIKSLPKFQLPFLRNGTYRAFEIKGDSMLPITEGSIIVGQYVDNQNSLEIMKPYIFVTINDGIIYKRLQNSTFKTFKLLSDNPLYDPFDIEKTEIIEIWKAKICISNII